MKSDNEYASNESKGFEKGIFDGGEREESFIHDQHVSFIGSIRSASRSTFSFLWLTSYGYVELS